SGGLVSLDEATSVKKRFDVARILISAEVLRPIFASVPVFAANQRFLIHVVEESSGETIFSTGKDRGRVHSQPVVEKSTHSDSKSGGDELLVVPCSLSSSTGNQRKVSTENSSSHDNGEAPISSETNDDKCCKKLGLGKNHYTVKNGQILGKSWTEENSNYSCVSSSGKF
ncbi:hypothetical protein Ancab_002329, partial [Ancistrocladus abbreviatus]